jgi:curli biogenesis system outer membrane secretion channel CsgG
MKIAKLTISFGAAAIALMIQAPVVFADTPPLPTLAQQATQVDQLVQHDCTKKASRCDNYKKKGEKVKTLCTTNPARCQKEIVRWQKHDS